MVNVANHFSEEYREVLDALNKLGDYTSVEFGKVMNEQAKIKTNTAIGAVTAVALTGVSTLYLVYHIGKKSGGGGSTEVANMGKMA